MIFAIILIKERKNGRVKILKSFSYIFKSFTLSCTIFSLFYEDNNENHQ